MYIVRNMIVEYCYYSTDDNDPQIQQYIYRFISTFLSLLPKYGDCTTSIGFELYLMCFGVMLLLLIIYIYAGCLIKFDIIRDVDMA